MKKQTRKPNRAEAISQRLKWIKAEAAAVESGVRRDRAAHRRAHVNGICANALLAHVCDVIEFAGIDYGELSAAGALAEKMGLPKRGPAHANRVSQVMAKVTEMLDRAMEELVSQPADLEELECLLNEVVK